MDRIREVIQCSRGSYQISNMLDETPRPVKHSFPACYDEVFWPADGSVFLIIIRPLVHQNSVCLSSNPPHTSSTDKHTSGNLVTEQHRLASCGLAITEPIKPVSVGHLASSPPPLTSLCLTQSEASSPPGPPSAEALRVRVHCFH